MIRNFAVIIVLGASCVTTAARAESGTWRVTESSGEVQILHAGISRIATRGGALQSGDTVITGKAARAVVVRGEDYLVVAPNSRFRIAPPAPTSNFVQILEDWGNLVFKIKKTGVPHFGVQTPYLAAVVKGTTFSITVTERGSSVQVIEGAVQVSTLNGGATELVRPGMIAVVSGDNLQRLDVQGDGSRGSGAPARPDASDAGSDKASGEGNAITAAIGDDGSNLGEATNGLITGSAAPVALLASALSARNDARMPPATPDSPSVGGASAGEVPPAPVDVGMPGDGAAGTGNPGPADDKGGSGAGSDGAGSGGSGSNDDKGAGNGSSSGGEGSGSGSGTDGSGSGHGDSHGHDHSGSGNGKGNSGNGNGNGGGDGAGNSGKGGGRGNSQNGNGGDGVKGSGKSK